MLFCGQYGQTSPNGGTYEYNSQFRVELNSGAYQRIAEYIYFGYTMKHGAGLPATTEARKDACATQQFVWEYIRDNINSQYGAPGRDSWKNGYMSSSIYASWLSETESTYNNYHNSNVSFNGDTGKATVGESMTYTDVNGVLASYETFSKTTNGVTFSHTQGSNDLIVTVDENANVSSVSFNSNAHNLYRLINGNKYSSHEMSSYMYFHFTSGAIQDLIFSSYVDPTFFSFNMKVECGKINIIKQDSETMNNTQGDATFEGAEYKVYAAEDIYNASGTKKCYSKDDLVATRIMKQDGTTEIVDKLPLGKYLVKETASSEGYLLDTQNYIIDLKDTNPNITIVTKNVTSNEVVKKMQVHIFKSGIKENSGLTPGLEGVRFSIKLNSAVEKAYSQGYTYAEVWDGIDENGNKVEVDSKRVAKAQEIAPTYQTIETNENGNAYSKVLPYGKYICKEVYTPQDYETAEDFTFTIDKDSSEIKEVAQEVKHLVVNNEQMEAYIKLIKKDVKTGKTVSLSSATFEIKATKDIYDRATGKIIWKKGESITQKIGSTTYSSFTTNAENIVIPKEDSYNNKNDETGSVVTPLKLPVGSYAVYELNTPEGFLQLEKPVNFEIKAIRDYDKDKDEDAIKEVTITNEQPTGTLIVDKSVALRENVDTSLVDISDIGGIQFKLTAKTDIIDKADGSTIYSKGQEVGTYNVDKEGNLKIEELPMGEYELVETKTLDGLVLNDTIYDVKFEKKDNTTKVYTETREVKNDTTLIEVSKTTITGEQELSGAELSIIDKDGNVIDSWTSSDKTHTIEGLVVGEEYTLREDLAPLGYVKSTDIKFKVENTEEIQKVEMIDKIVEMSKKNIAGDELEGATIVVTNTRTKNIVDKWVSGKEPHRIQGLIEGETYIMHEEIAIDGYVKATDIEFTVTEDKETQHIEMVDKIVLISKTDLVTGEELPGAELIVTDEDGNEVDRWVSTDTPHQVTGLEEGKEYTLTEITCPYGFEQAESITFKVSTDKETQKIEMKDMPILSNIKVVKIDSDTKEIIKAKFTFGLYADEECTQLIKQVDSNKEEGTGLFEDLRFGTYFIKEISAPKGYELSNEIVKLEINDKGVFINGTEITENDEVYSFEFANKQLPKIQTGNEINYAILIGSIVISLLGITTGTIVLRKRKQKNN